MSLMLSLNCVLRKIAANPMIYFYQQEGILCDISYYYIVVKF